MAEVYGSAYVTIAADAVPNSTTGCIDGKNRRMGMPKRLLFPYNGRKGVVYVRERGMLAYQLPYHNRAKGVTPDTTVSKEVKNVLEDVCRLNATPENALSKRGWVFQERGLSPRRLHFV